MIHQPQPYGPIPLSTDLRVLVRDGGASPRHGHARHPRHPSRRREPQTPLHAPSATTLLVSLCPASGRQEGARVHMATRSAPSPDGSDVERVEASPWAAAESEQRDGLGRYARPWLRSSLRTAVGRVRGLGMPRLGVTSAARRGRIRLSLRVARLRNARPTARPFGYASYTIRGSL